MKRDEIANFQQEEYFKMHNQDYLNGFAQAKEKAEAIAKSEIEAALKELTYKLGSSVKERTQVRKNTAQKITRKIRKIAP